MGRGKSKLRVKGNSKKLKRWKKGHSSDSNPSAHSHRDSAKNRFFHVKTGPSQLTSEALAKHDSASMATSMSPGDDDMDTISDSRSEGGLSAKTFNTWASNWTDCTNATFNKVHRFWGSSTALHKEILAVLAAVTEVIKQEGGTESETTYFAALMTTLESVETEMSATAVTYLLELAIKRVPAPVLKSRFSDVSKSLITMLGAHANTDMPALLKSLLMCLAHLLRVQDAGVWSYSSTMQVYNSLLSFTTSSKPKVRKAAQNAVRVVLKGSSMMTSPQPPACHPAAAATAKFCVQQMETSGGSADSTSTLHVLGLLQNILASFPLRSTKVTCETILKVMTLANVIVTSTAFKTFHATFMAKPKETCLSAELNAQLITALYDYQPSTGDSQQMSAWLAVMESAHCNLNRLNSELCLSHVAKLFSVCMHCLQNNNSTLCQVAAKTAKNLLKDCIEPNMEHLQKSSSKSSSSATLEQSAIYRMFEAAEAGLGYQYHASWQLVLTILNTFFEIAGKEFPGMMKKCLLSLADLRDSHRFAYQRDLDSVFGMAVRRMGPRAVLNAVPLNITGQNDNLDFPRSWLLPVMRENIRDTELGFFSSYFLPLASKLRTIAVEHAKRKEQVQAKTYDALQQQMWSLLPGFCTQPTDFAQSFAELARYLGMALTDREDLRRDVMTALSRLLRQSQQTVEMKGELGKFSKNYLPILFNLYCADAEKERDQTRQVALTTVKAYLPVTSPPLISSYFDRCTSKLDEADITGPKQHAYLDLVTAMIPYLDEPRVHTIYTWATSKLQSSDKRLQKKSYVAVETLLGCAESAACRQFVLDNLSALQATLVTALATASPLAKAPRLRCLLNIFKQLKDPQTDFITAVIPEAVSCVKQQNERARKCAYALLVELGHVVQRWSPGSGGEEAALGDYVHMLLGGLQQQDAHLTACTLLTLTHVVYQFKNSISKPLLDELLGHATRLLTSRSREVVTTSLAFVKMLLSRFSDTALAPHLSVIVASLVSMEKDQKHHFRFKAKEIYGKLVKKFGYEIISDMLPEEQQKQIRNIRKTEERAKRKKSTKADDNDDDDDDEEMPVAKTKVESIDELLQDSDSEPDDGHHGDKQRKKVKATKKKGGKAWLREGSDGAGGEEGENIVDFLDSSVSKKVLATQPGREQQQSSKLKHSFKTSSDGKLIITENDDVNDVNDVSKKAKKKKAIKRRAEEENDDDIADLMDALSGQHLKNKKKKVASAPGAEDRALVETMVGEGGASGSYKPGGHGIHRPLTGQTGQATTESHAKPKYAGAEYRSKKATGDIKRKDKPDPYAYIPLEMNLLNRRKKAKASGQFKSLVAGAKKGARKGVKNRTKTRK